MKTNMQWTILFRCLGICVLLILLSLSQRTTEASNNLAAYTCDDAVDQIPVLPSFKLPYPSSENSIKLSSGPHMFGNLDLSSKFPYGCGTGLDFAKGGQTFPVTAMAGGELMAYGCDMIPGFGCMAVIRHDGGESVMLYAHMDRNRMMPFFPLHIPQGYVLGYAGNSGTTDVHLHIELRKSYDPATGKLGKRIGWERVAYNGGTIDGYRIYGYADGNYSSSSMFYNYDGVAVKGTERVIYGFNFTDYDGSNRTGVTTVVGEKYDKNYEDNTIDVNTQFSGKGVLGGGGYLYSSNQPVDNGSDDNTAPSGNFTGPSNNSTINSRTVTVSASASDNSGGSGVREVRFKARWPGVNWTDVGADSSSPYSVQWDMCNFSVPQGIIDLDLDVYDNAGNKYTYSSNNIPLRITKNYDCSGSGLPSADQWHAEAWMNKYLAGLVNKSEYWPAGVTNVTYPFIGFEKNFGDGAPYAGFPSDEFSFKIYSNLYFRGGQYHFRVCSDDGVVFEIDGQKVFDEWWDRGGCLQTDRSLDNKYHTLEVRYYENRGSAYIRLYIWGEEFPQPELDEPDGRITSPSNNTFVSQNPLTIWADAWDDKSGVDRVKFKVYHCVGGCQWRDLGTDDSAPYRLDNWDWSSLEGQQVKLAIDVTDKSGRTRGNAGGEITVTLDKTPPNVSVTSPTNGAFDPDKQVAINVTASDSVSGVTSVKFFAGYEDGTNNYWHEIGTDTNSSDGWGMNWNASSLPDGKVVDVYTAAYDGAGNMGGAVVYAITLGNPQKYIYLPAITNGSTSVVTQEQIVFVSRANGNSEIYSINTNGTGLSRLTNDSSEDVYPNYSPDGSKIVFSSKRTGKEQIYTMLANGSQQTRLLADAYDDGVPEWSPDGTKIAFTRYADYDGNGVRGEVFVMNSDGSNVNRLTTTSGKTDSYTHGCWSSGWSPDSKKILYYCYVGYDQIWMMNSDGSNKQLILNDSYWNAFPKMSPDGKKIVFVSWRYNNYDVYTVNPDGSSLTRLTTHSTDEWAPDWSPDGKKILFEANRDGKTQVYWMNVDGTQQTRITDNTSYAGQGRWRPK